MSRKVHQAPPQSAREAALQAMVRMESNGAFLNLVLPALARELQPKDRALAYQLAIGTVQRLNTLDWALAPLLHRPLTAFTSHIRNTLRLGAYQLIYLDRVPDHAVVHQAVELALRFGHRGVAALVNAVLRRLSERVPELPWPDPNKDPLEYLVIRHSQPRWLAERRLKRYGLTEAEKLCLAENRPAPIALRYNRLRITRERLQSRLLQEGLKVEPETVLPAAVRVPPGSNPAGLDSFRAGLFSIQGESSMLVAPLVDPRPGEHVLDLCSAPGGKTAHLAELMEDRGLVTAVDLHRRRLRLVEEACRRLGLTAVRTREADGREVHRLSLAAPDRVLVDAPCSGLGVIRRLPELKWRRSENDLSRLQKLQLALLQSAARCLRPGGRLVYSVCSNEPEETGAVIAAFLQDNRDFSLARALTLPEEYRPRGCRQDIAEGILELLPHRHDLDGFFIAVLQKNR